MQILRCFLYKVHKTFTMIKEFKMTRSEMIKINIEYMLKYVGKFLNIAIDSWPIILLLIGSSIVVMVLYEKITKCKVSIYRKVIIIISTVYVWALMYMAIGARRIGSVRNIDFIPFNEEGGFIYIVFYAIINLLIFLPLGMLLPELFRKMRKIKNTVWVGFTLSLCIEVAQYVLACGDSQTEDIIMNTLGCYVGYKLWNVFDKKRVHKQHSNV